MKNFFTFKMETEGWMSSLQIAIHPSIYIVTSIKIKEPSVSEVFILETTVK